MTITLHSLNLSQAERALCEHALRAEGTLVGAAERLGITRHSLKRRIIKHNILWPIPRTGVRPGMFGPDSLLSVTPAPTAQRQPHSVPTAAPTRTLSPTIMGKSAPAPMPVKSTIPSFGQR